MLHRVPFGWRSGNGFRHPGLHEHSDEGGLSWMRALDGLGLLSYESVVRRDYPVVLGTLYLFTLIGLATKLISDLCYVWVDPRIQFEQLER